MTQLLAQLPTDPPQRGLPTFKNINSIVQALATDFSGPNDPATGVTPLLPWAYATWADTANGVFKRRDGTNSSWVTEGLLLRAHAPMMTFAQIDALTSDIGPIICTDMAGALYVWTSSAYFTGYRNPLCGEIPRNFVATPRAWELAATGGVWNDGDPKQKRVIAHFREQGLVVPSANWLKGQAMISDLGGGDWKAPDLRDMFLRFAGTDADTANAAPPGTYKADALQNITGVIGDTGFGGSSGAFYGNVADVGAFQANVAAANLAHVWFDASRVARTSVETRGANARVAPIILI